MLARLGDIERGELFFRRAEHILILERTAGVNIRLAQPLRAARDDNAECFLGPACIDDRNQLQRQPLEIAGGKPDI